MSNPISEREWMALLLMTIQDEWGSVETWATTFIPPTFCERRFIEMTETNRNTMIAKLKGMEKEGHVVVIESKGVKHATA